MVLADVALAIISRSCAPGEGVRAWACEGVKVWGCGEGGLER